MLKSNERVTVYMEGHIDSDYGKMGTGVRPERTELLIMNYNPEDVVEPMNNFNELFEEEGTL